MSTLMTGLKSDGFDLEEQIPGTKIMRKTHEIFQILISYLNWSIGSKMHMLKKLVSSIMGIVQTFWFM